MPSARSMSNLQSHSDADNAAVTLKITRHKEYFGLVITLPELYWMAGVLGFMRLTLPMTPSTLSETQIQKAQESLSARGLIRRVPGAGWQVDRLTAFLVHWLGETERCAFLEIHRRDGKLQKAGLFQLNELSLMVLHDQENIEFILCSDNNALWSEWTRRFGIATGGADKGAYQLPELVQLIELAWRNPEAARRAFLIAGIPKAAGSAILTWIDSLKTAVLFTPFPAQSDSKLLILCSDGKSAWIRSSDGTQKKEKPDEFHPCSLEEAATQIWKFL
jgi:hypothetical protein